MWQCKQCFYKNNNSTKKCHGHNCKGKRETEAFEIPRALIQPKKKQKHLYDFCPACQKDMLFTPTIWKGKKAWSCESGKHRPCIFSGKSKPIPQEMVAE